MTTKSLDKGKILKLLKDKKNFLFKNFAVTEISLFGSFARDEQNDESDIDFYVDMPASYDKIFRLKEFLERTFNRRVDIIRKRPSLRKRLLEEVEKDAVNA